MKARKHKSCHNNGGGQGMCPAKCEICKREFIYQSGIQICETCIIFNNLCYVCGEKLELSQYTNPIPHCINL